MKRIKTGAIAIVPGLLLLFSSCTKEALTEKVTNTNTSNVVTTLRIGDSYGGGIIFYLDSTKRHGLIAATTNILYNNTYPYWWNGSYVRTGAKGSAVGEGKSNTDKIIAAQGVGNYAAYLCRHFNGGGFTDWYMPDKKEMIIMLKKRSVIPNLGSNSFLSSTEASKTTVVLVNIAGDGSTFVLDKNIPASVRAIRQF